MSVVVARRRKTPAEFWDSLEPAGDCLLHPGSGVYPKIKVEGVPSRRADGKESVHRVAWFLTDGPIPDGMMVLHHCDTPPCCRPSHLYLGTQRENAFDRERRGRAGSNVGVNVRRYSDQDYDRVREAAARLPNLSAVARETGISRSHVGRILSGWSAPS